MNALMAMVSRIMRPIPRPYGAKEREETESEVRGRKRGRQLAVSRRGQRLVANSDGSICKVPPKRSHVGGLGRRLSSV